MNQVRVQGDPFGDGVVATRLRAFVQHAHERGLRCAITLPSGGHRPLPDTLAAITVPAVSSSAPVVVFAAARELGDAALAAGLRWPRACVVMPATDGAAVAGLVDRVRAELRWAGVADPAAALTERELQPWFVLPVPPADGPIVTLHDGDADSGVASAIAAWREVGAATGRGLRVVVTTDEPSALAFVGEVLGDDVLGVEVVVGPFAPVHLFDASLVVLPWRRVGGTRALVQSLAAGRPVCASWLPPVAELLPPVAACPIVGDVAPDGSFTPAPGAVAAAMRAGLERCHDAIAVRTFVREELTADRSSPPPSPIRGPGARPTVVFEVVLGDDGPSVAGGIDVVRAVLADDVVDVRLVATAVADHGIAALRARAPELVSRLTRDPGVVAAWIGIPSPWLAVRPPCRTFVAANATPVLSSHAAPDVVLLPATFASAVARGLAAIAGVRCEEPLVALPAAPRRTTVAPLAAVR